MRKVKIAADVDADKVAALTPGFILDKPDPYSVIDQP
jgi:hypothetical protein